MIEPDPGPTADEEKDRHEHGSGEGYYDEFPVVLGTEEGSHDNPWMDGPDSGLVKSGISNVIIKPAPGYTAVHIYHASDGWHAKGFK